MTSAVTPTLESATWGRRILALVVDWLACLAVVEGLVAVGVLGSNPNGLGTLALFVLESALFTATTGGSFGKLVTRVRVVDHRDPSRPVPLLRSLLRSVLVGLLVPPLLTFDGRGVHDLAAGTRTVTL
ncbi:RDD family protein [Nocardioides okcheonensis]|uniref:RDD family protein n=1 Tax=Nocardioides okcheonensis TaxID=2894081 RepID=UPI001E4CB525|nr:RDD family protein [Nocardioides okcheonensis]UFN44730.1 RDD family protein [Nocardioides okcheonensis]